MTENTRPSCPTCKWVSVHQINCPDSTVLQSGPVYPDPMFANVAYMGKRALVSHDQYCCCDTCK